MIINAQILRATKGYGGRTMRRNEARQLIPEEQITESPKPMEDRLKRIETDVADLRNDMKAANEAIAEVKGAVTALRGDVNTLRGEVNGRFTALETEIRGNEATLRAEAGTQKAELLRAIEASENTLIKWMVGTMIASLGTAIACAGLALAIGKVIFVTKVP
jgi:chromosome segregation ATPase